MATVNKFDVQQSKKHIYQSYLDPMTLILYLNLDMAKISNQTKSKVSVSMNSKVIVRMDIQADRHTHTHMCENIAFPHTLTVITSCVTFSVFEWKFMM